MRERPRRWMNRRNHLGPGGLGSAARNSTTAPPMSLPFAERQRLARSDNGKVPWNFDAPTHLGRRTFAASRCLNIAALGQTENFDYGAAMRNARRGER